MAVRIDKGNTRKIEIIIPSAGESVFYTLKVPSREAYQKNRDGLDVEGADVEALDAELFAGCLVGIDNLEHEDGTPATPENDIDIIPMAHKRRCLVQLLAHGALNAAEKVEEVKKP